MVKEVKGKSATKLQNSEFQIWKSLFLDIRLHLKTSQDLRFLQMFLDNVNTNLNV